MESSLQHTESAAATRHTWWVVCLCAQWCGVCREYRSAFDALARDWPQLRFEWVDVEDDEDMVGDLDVETFPTILIADGAVARFFGTMLPQAQVLGRMLQSLQADPAAPAADAQAQALFERIAAHKA
ncbi:MAG: thioredoxin family protein [Proteobacteria bacterium]|nr:thioredoxin family protein [Pseudomonadota bacterium]